MQGMSYFSLLDPKFGYSIASGDLDPYATPAYSNNIRPIQIAFPNFILYTDDLFYDRFRIIQQEEDIRGAGELRYHFRDIMRQNCHGWKFALVRAFPDRLQFYFTHQQYGTQFAETHLADYDIELTVPTSDGDGAEKFHLVSERDEHGLHHVKVQRSSQPNIIYDIGLLDFERHFHTMGALGQELLISAFPNLVGDRAQELFSRWRTAPPLIRLTTIVQSPIVATGPGTQPWSTKGETEAV